jgi:hypothetical protein
MHTQCDLQNPQFFVRAIAQGLVCLCEHKRASGLFSRVQCGVKYNKIMQLSLDECNAERKGRGAYLR